MKSIGRHTFSAFKNRNYTLFFIGQSISRIGTWMQRTAVLWVVYTLTHSNLMLGVTMFAEQFPSFLFSLVGGVVSDRYNRHKILLVTQSVSMVQAILLTVLILTNHYVVWEILSLSILLGIINAFDVPARQPLVHEMVNSEADLPNALALNSTLTNLAKLLGPALSGIILEQFGAGTCFLLNAVSFIAVIACLLMMKLPPYKPVMVKKKMLLELAEGFTYLRRTPLIGRVLLMLTLLSLFILPYNTLLPVFAKEVFNGNAATYGYINSFIGLGAVIGAIYLASLKPNSNHRKILLINTVVVGVGLILFSHLRLFPLAMAFAIITGFGAMAQTTVSNIMIQVNSDVKMRGRVMSFLAMAMFGMLPLGSLLIGFVSQHIGAPDTLLCQGILALITAAVFAKYLKNNRQDKQQELLSIKTENKITQEV